MRRSEALASIYFLYLLVPTVMAPITRSRKLRLSAAALACVALAWLPGRLPASTLGTVVRDWTPGVLLLAGYWLPGALFIAPNETIERWLLALDHRVFGIALRNGPFRHLPAWFREYLELTYLFCYPLVPLSFAVVYFGGTTRSNAIDAFWSTVLLSVFTCYGLLPWIQTRPPRVLEPPVDPVGIRRLNALVLHRVSVQVNTFPSGHVAAAVAATIELLRYEPWAGLVVGLISVSIAAAAFVGRYHYLADVVLGGVLALGAGWVSSSW
jgi:hypothetical protein